MESSMSPQVLTFSMYTGFGGFLAATGFMLIAQPPVWGAMLGYTIGVGLTALFGWLLRDIP